MINIRLAAILAAIVCIVTLAVGVGVYKVKADKAQVQSAILKSDRDSLKVAADAYKRAQEKQVRIQEYEHQVTVDIQRIRKQTDTRVQSLTVQEIEQYDPNLW